MATLLAIDHDGPVKVTELGQRHEGIVWEVQPENFPRLIEMVNAHGGPNHWRIDPIPA